MLIDSHCHFSSLGIDIQKEIAKSCSSNCYFIDSSIDQESSQAAVELAKQYDFLYTSLGFHPFYADKFSDKVLAAYRKLINENKKILAIGEIGLDYKADSSFSKQQEAFSLLLQLAKEEDLAVFIHNRMSSDDEGLKVLEIIDEHFTSYQKVIFHCFSYSPVFLRKILQRQGLVSFSLNILRKNKNIVASLKECPLDNLLLETDSPYMKIGRETSTPLDISKVYSFAASIKGLGEEQLKESVFLNAKKIFCL